MTDHQPLIYPYASTLTPAPDFKVRANGKDVFVYDSHVGAIAAFGLRGRTTIEIEHTDRFEHVRVRPLRHGIKPEVSGSTIRFTIDAPTKLSIEFNDRLRRPLFLFADAPDLQVPATSDTTTRVFKAGQVHDAGTIELTTGQSIYIEGGAVVRGSIKAGNANNISVRGRGILDGSHFAQHEVRLVKFIQCQNVTFEGIIIHNSPSWTLVPVGCDDVQIRDIKIVNGRNSDDGIDVNGSQRVTIDNVFIRTKDDCIAIKAATYDDPEAQRDVRDITITNSVFWNAEWGNALEIGFETRCDSMSNITFRNCDVIHCEFEGYQSGGVLTIHNGDRAVITDVLYDDIRVEDAREKLLDFKVQHSHYSKDQTRGQVKRVRVKNLQVVDGIFPPSILQGINKEAWVEDVTIEGLCVHGQHITNQIDARMVVERCPRVKFI